MRFLDLLDARIVAWMARHGVTVLRMGLGAIFVWFGALKFFPGLSPAEELATRTIGTLSLGLVGADTARLMIAALEVLIGLGLMTGLYLRAVIALLFFQLVGTFTPVVLFPREVFQIIPFAPTLEGQYIFKNLVLIGAGLVIGATVRGGQAQPRREQARPSATS
jgi:uncharacterized membrane protein YphA (DoxX/SURF4 family)